MELLSHTKNIDKKNLTIDIIKQLFIEYKINSINDYKKVHFEIKSSDKGVDLPVDLSASFNKKGIKFSYEDYYYKNNYSNAYRESEIENV
jgi:hypothetical protein